VANPLATICRRRCWCGIRSGAAILADKIESAVQRVLAKGLRTGDIAAAGEKKGDGGNGRSSGQGTLMSKQMKYDVAVVGATGAVGEVMLAILAERKFPVGKVPRSQASAAPAPPSSSAIASSPSRSWRRSISPKVQIGLFSPGASVFEDLCAEGCGEGLRGDRQHVPIPAGP